VYVLNKLEVSVADRGGGIDHAQHPESVIVHVHEVFITHDGPTSTVLDKLASTQKQTKTEEDRGTLRGERLFIASHNGRAASTGHEL
jgi:hypothetical protein